MTKQHPGGRQLVLALSLLERPSGMTREELQKRVPGYQGLSEDASRRAFERDLETLRSVGLDVSVDSFSLRYRVARVNLSEDSLAFSKEEASLLSDAAATWSGEIGQELKAKVSLLTRRLAVSSISASFEGSEHAGVLLQAIAASRPVNFLYVSRGGTEERDVLPEEVTVRGRSLYLEGFDLNRLADRSFRLGRIKGDIELVGEAGEMFPGRSTDGPRGRGDGGIFEVAPLLKVRAGAAPLVRMRAENIVSSDGGWDVVQCARGGARLWERLILENVEDVVVLQPIHLQGRIYSCLEAIYGKK